MDGDPHHHHHQAVDDEMPPSSTSKSRLFAQTKHVHNNPTTKNAVPNNTGGIAPLFPMPPAASTPVTSHFDAILECQDLLSCMEDNPSVDKQDVIDSMRSMLNTMISTIMMHNFSTSMSVQGWKVQ